MTLNFNSSCLSSLKTPAFSNSAWTSSEYYCPVTDSFAVILSTEIGSVSVFACATWRTTSWRCAVDRTSGPSREINSSWCRWSDVSRWRKRLQRLFIEEKDRFTPKRHNTKCTYKFSHLHVASSHNTKHRCYKIIQSILQHAKMLKLPCFQ